MEEKLRRRLQSGKLQDLIGALVKKWIEISVNPADYIPETPYTREMKENLE